RQDERPKKSARIWVCHAAPRHVFTLHLRYALHLRCPPNERRIPSEMRCAGTIARQEAEVSERKGTRTCLIPSVKATTGAPRLGSRVPALVVDPIRRPPLPNRPLRSDKDLRLWRSLPTRPSLRLQGRAIDPAAKRLAR